MGNSLQRHDRSDFCSAGCDEIGPSFTIVSATPVPAALPLFVTRPGACDRPRPKQHCTIVNDRQLKAAHPKFCRSRRGRRASKPVRTQLSKCGCRVAHASIAISSGEPVHPPKGGRQLGQTCAVIRNIPLSESHSATYRDARPAYCCVKSKIVE